MTPELILHDRTRRLFEAYLQAPTHALLLVAPSGAGKRSAAEYLAASLLDIPTAKLQGNAYFRFVSSPDESAISIDAVRELEHFFRLKVPSERSINRVAVVENSHLLTTEAQNALLKTLEEPPTGSALILTANQPLALLPTIRSRAQTLQLLQPGLTSLQVHFGAQGFSDRDIQQAYVISGGLPGLMQGLLTESDHPLKPATEWARNLLQQTPYERLLAVDELSKQRRLSLDICFILQQMAHISIQKSLGKGAQRWQHILEASYRAAEALDNSGQPKLVLTNLMVNLT